MFQVDFKGMITRLLVAGITGFAVISSSVCIAQQPLFSAVQAPQGKSPRDASNQQGVQRQRFVSINASAVNTLASAKGVDKPQFIMDFFDDARFLVTMDKMTTLPAEPKSYQWQGRVAGKPLAKVNISIVEDATLVDLRLMDGVSYSIRYRGDGIHEVQEILESAQGTCGTDSSLVPPEPVAPQASSAMDAPLAADAIQTSAADLPPTPGDSASEIDVLIVYTAEAETQAGGPSGMQALINQAFSMANSSYSESQIPLTIIKAGTYKVNYTPSTTDMGVDLARITGKNDGYMDDIHAQRDLVKADMVCLLRGNYTSLHCGIGYAMTEAYLGPGFEQYCFSVCANTCITNQTFAHELGHNMGCMHDRINAGEYGAYPYSYGWRWNGTSPSATQYRTIMAYLPGFRTSYFSNPNITFDGAPTGVAGMVDNALSITNTAPIVANFRNRAAGPYMNSYYSPVRITVSQGSDGTAYVYLGNYGTGTTNYTVTESAAWATISPTSGAASGYGAFNTHTLTLNTDSLAPGKYMANINMTDSGAINSPSRIPIELYVVAAPANDNFASAQVISGASGSVIGSSANATRQTGEPATIGEYNGVGANSIWYRWTAPSGNSITFDTTGSSFDTMLGVYTGALGSLTTIAQNDEGTGIEPLSRLNFTPNSGTTYYILVDGFQKARGASKLNWTTFSSVGDWTLY